MRVYVDIYDSNKEWQDTLECPLDTDILMWDYGEGYTLDGWRCEYDYITPILNRIDLEFANELSEYEPQDILEMYYDNWPDGRIFSMFELDSVVYIKGKALSEILGMFKNFSLNDDYFRFDGNGNIESLTLEEAEKEEKGYIVDMLYGRIG